MGKRPKRSQKGSKPKQKASEKSGAKTAEEGSKALDFGGLPERNLKKNLGC